MKEAFEEMPRFVEMFFLTLNSSAVALFIGFLTSELGFGGLIFLT